MKGKLRVALGAHATNVKEVFELQDDRANALTRMDIELMNLTRELNSYLMVTDGVTRYIVPHIEPLLRVGLTKLAKAGALSKHAKKVNLAKKHLPKYIARRMTNVAGAKLVSNDPLDSFENLYGAAIDILISISTLVEDVVSLSPDELHVGHKVRRKDVLDWLGRSDVVMSIARVRDFLEREPKPKKKDDDPITDMISEMIEGITAEVSLGTTT